MRPCNLVSSSPWEGNIQAKNNIRSILRLQNGYTLYWSWQLGNLTELDAAYTNILKTHTHTDQHCKQKQTHFWQWQAILSPQKNTHRSLIFKNLNTEQISIRLSPLIIFGANKIPQNKYPSQQLHISIPVEVYFWTCCQKNQAYFHLPLRKNSTKSIKNHHVIYQIRRKPPICFAVPRLFRSTRL